MESSRLDCMYDKTFATLFNFHILKSPFCDRIASSEYIQWHSTCSFMWKCTFSGYRLTPGIPFNSTCEYTLPLRNTPSVNSIYIISIVFSITSKFIYKDNENVQYKWYSSQCLITSTAFHVVSSNYGIFRLRGNWWFELNLNSQNVNEGVIHLTLLIHFFVHTWHLLAMCSYGLFVLQLFVKWISSSQWSQIYSSLFCSLNAMDAGLLHAIVWKL